MGMGSVDHQVASSSPVAGSNPVSHADPEGVTVSNLILQVLTQWLTVIAIGLSVDCAYHAPTEPTPAVTVASTAAASIRLGVSTLTDRTYNVTATVLTGDGRFVPGVTIAFAIEGGTVSPETARTNTNGVAQAVATALSPTTTLSVSGASLSTSTTLAGVPTPTASTPVEQPPTTTPPLGPFGVTISATNVVVGAETLMTAQVTGTPRSFAWNFGDSVSVAGASPSIGHTYGAIGTYLVSLVITDGSGRTASALTTANVRKTPDKEPLPTLDASITCNPARVQTTCNVSVTYGGSPLPASKMTGTRWDWGDGTALEPRTTPTAQHDYPQSGTYIVMVEVTATTPSDTLTTTTAKTINVP